MDPDMLADRMLSLEREGVHNINFVTGAHVLPAVAEAIRIARTAGLAVPVVWNSGGYETVEALRTLEGLVDIYLPDFKFFDPDLSEALCGARNYATVAQAALLEMVRQTGAGERMDGPLLQRGLILRHLVLPGSHKDSLRILEWAAAHLPPDTRLSILSQYTPVEKPAQYAPLVEPAEDTTLSRQLRRRVTTYEYEKVLEKAISLGFTRILGQERPPFSSSTEPSVSSGTGGNPSDP
jgi:putative pyruvate formate lyase activating enzyme